jgi:hypothetical protein
MVAQTRKLAVEMLCTLAHCSPIALRQLWHHEAHKTLLGLLEDPVRLPARQTPATLERRLTQISSS